MVGGSGDCIEAHCGCWYGIFVGFFAGEIGEEKRLFIEFKRGDGEFVLKAEDADDDEREDHGLDGLAVVHRTVREVVGDGEDEQCEEIG